MTRNTIIAGVPRSGKSTLAKRLCAERGTSYFPMDSLVSTFGRVFPETGITHYDESHQRACRAFRPFLCEFLKHLEYEDFGFVADLYHLLPEDVASERLADRYHVLYLGYPSADCVAKCRHIRADARAADWTSQLSDEELGAIVAGFVQQSRSIEEVRGRLGIRFVDTSQGFAGVLDEAFLELPP